VLLAEPESGLRPDGPDGLDGEIPMRVRELLACPDCGGLMSFAPDLCKCECGQSFTATQGLFSFATKDFTDKYDTAGMASRYVQYAFGSQVRRVQGTASDGRSEGLYRAISDICRGELLARRLQAPVIVDLACGVGRSIYDIASVHAGATAIGLDLSAGLARCASRICSGQPVPCGAAEDGWPAVEFARPPLPNVFIAQANACSPPLRHVTDESAGADILLLSMILDRLRTPREVSDALVSAAGIVAVGGLLVVSTPFNWTTEETWREFSLSRTWLAEAIERMGLAVETYFDYLPYKESLDPFGTILELPVQICTARRLGR
jgi:SAM-dependent methyltransferase